MHAAVSRTASAAHDKLVAIPRVGRFVDVPQGPLSNISASRADGQRSGNAAYARDPSTVEVLLTPIDGQ